MSTNIALQVSYGGGSENIQLAFLNGNQWENITDSLYSESGIGYLKDALPGQYYFKDTTGNVYYIRVFSNVNPYSSTYYVLQTSLPNNGVSPFLNSHVSGNDVWYYILPNINSTCQYVVSVNTDYFSFGDFGNGWMDGSPFENPCQNVDPYNWTCNVTGYAATCGYNTDAGCSSSFACFNGCVDGTTCGKINLAGDQVSGLDGFSGLTGTWEAQCVDGQCLYPCDSVGTQCSLLEALNSGMTYQAQDIEGNGQYYCVPTSSNGGGSPPTRPGCSVDSDCPNGLVCGVDGYCQRAPPTTDPNLDCRQVGCSVGSVCNPNTGMCVYPPAGGPPTQPPSGNGGKVVGKGTGSGVLFFLVFILIILIGAAVVMALRK